MPHIQLCTPSTGNPEASPPEQQSSGGRRRAMDKEMYDDEKTAEMLRIMASSRRELEEINVLIEEVVSDVSETEYDEAFDTVDYASREDTDVYHDMPDLEPETETGSESENGSASDNSGGRKSKGKKHALQAAAELKDSIRQKAASPPKPRTPSSMPAGFSEPGQSLSRGVRTPSRRENT